MSTTLPETESAPKPSVCAAVLLWALELIRDAGSWPRSVSEILALTGSGRSQAYEMLPRLKAAAATLEMTPGRKQTPAADADVALVLRSTRDFLMDHPGAVGGPSSRRGYSDGFRRFVCGLAAPGQPAADMTVEQLADAVGVPLGTIKDWLAVSQTAAPADNVSNDADADGRDHPLTSQPQIATVLTEWESWEGNFSDFCNYIRTDHHLPFGPTFISHVLQAAGLRDRPRRQRQDAPWSRGTFRDLFPGAQWLGDGTTVAITWNGRPHAFNVEPMHDPAADAYVGVTVSEEEDEQAVIDTYCQATATTTEPPLAVTLDNRPSNSTPAVEAAISPAILLRATPRRGQAKAPLEGSFGLFSQIAPPLSVSGRTEHELARSVLSLIFTIWAWTRNGKPRRALGGKSPAAFYTQYVASPEERDAARDFINELRRREEVARRTRERRADPVRRTILQDALVAFDILDPDHRLAVALARYSQDAILRGIATFAAKRDHATVPPDADPGRYLGGIIRNLDAREKLETMAQHLLALRIRHRDLTLAPLQAEAHMMRTSVPASDLPQVFLDCALAAGRVLDFRFWTSRSREALASLPSQTATDLYPHLARRVAASFHTDKQRREDLIAALSQAVVSSHDAWSFPCPVPDPYSNKKEILIIRDAC